MKSPKKLNWETKKTIYPSDILKKIVVVKKGTRKQRDRALKKSLGRDINPPKMRVLAKDEEYVEIKAPEKKHWREGEPIKEIWKKQYRPKIIQKSQSEKRRIPGTKRNAVKTESFVRLIKLSQDISIEKKISKILDSELLSYEKNIQKRPRIPLRPSTAFKIPSQKRGLKQNNSDWIYKNKIVIRHPSILHSIKQNYSKKSFCPLEKREVSNNELFDKAMEAKRLIEKRKNQEIVKTRKFFSPTIKRNRIKSFMRIEDSEVTSFANKVSEYMNKAKIQKPKKQNFRRGSIA